MSEKNEVVVSNQQDVLELLSSGEIDAEQAGDLLDQLNAPAPKELEVYWTDKGSLGVKNLRKGGLKLKPEEWERVAPFVPTILEAIEAGQPEAKPEEGEGEKETETEAAA